MRRYLLIFLYIIAAAFQSTLWGMESEASPVCLRVERTTGGGLKFSNPNVMHKDFFVSEEAFKQTYKSLLSEPFSLHKACLNSIKPGFDSLMSCHSSLVAFSKMNSAENLQNYQQSHQALLKLCQEIHQTCPLAFFQECDGGKKGNCPLTRTANKIACPRESFIQNTESRLFVLETALNPVFYAAGDCFAEIEIMARLKKAGHRLGTIVLIEPAFKILQKTLTEMSKGKSIFDLEKNNIDFTVQPLAMKSIFQILQMLYFLKHLESESSVVVYLDHKSYLSDVSLGTILPSRLIVALDYQDDLRNNNVTLDDELTDIWSSLALAEGGLLAKAHGVIADTNGTLGIKMSFEVK